MAHIQHIAVFAKDQEKLADFYKTTFGMREVHRHFADEEEEHGAYALYLSDGHINLAILPAGEGRPEGVDHFGFQVDDVDAVADTALRAGALQAPKAVPQDGRFAESFIRDPAGQRVDLSARGWRT